MTSTVADRVVDMIWYELSDPGYRWDPTLARYRNMTSGRIVSERAILSITERYGKEAIAPRVESITARMIDGRMNLGDWQRAMAKEIKDSHIVSASAGRGGRAQMTQADWGKAGSRIKFEYQHLNQFAQDVKAGKLSTEQIKFRAQMYVDGSRSSFYDGLTSANRVAGLSEERRITTADESCPDCLDYEAMGWQPIGTLPEPGTKSVCNHNCKCYKEYQ